jgi:hypothetical protein
LAMPNSMAMTGTMDKNVHICSMCIKNQLSRQTGSRNLTGPKTLPTIWYTYMTLVTKYQISAIKVLNTRSLPLSSIDSSFLL